MNTSQRLKILTESGRTVFTPLDLRLLWHEPELSAKVSAIRMVKNGLIVRIAKGYYALNNRYNSYELANRIMTPSYGNSSAVQKACHCEKSRHLRWRDDEAIPPPR